MAIQMCPMAADFGNLADWAAVAVALAGAVAVFMLSRAANRTANASLELNKMIQARDDELHRRERRLLAREIYVEVNVVWGEVQKIRRSIHHASRFWSGEDGLARSIQQLELHVAERERDRLHVLPGASALDIADAQIRIRQLKEHAHTFTTTYRGDGEGNEFVRVLTASAQLAEDALAAAFHSLGAELAYKA